MGTFHYRLTCFFLCVFNTIILITKLRTIANESIGILIYTLKLYQLFWRHWDQNYFEEDVTNTRHRDFTHANSALTALFRLQLSATSSDRPNSWRTDAPLQISRGPERTWIIVLVLFFVRVLVCDLIFFSCVCKLGQLCCVYCGIFRLL